MGFNSSRGGSAGSSGGTSPALPVAFQGSIPVFASINDLPTGASNGDQAFVISDLFEFDGTSWVLRVNGNNSILITDIDASQNAIDTDLGPAPTTDEVRRFHVLNSDNGLTFSSPSPINVVDAPYEEGDIIEAWTVTTRQPVNVTTTQPDNAPNTVRWIIEPGVIELERSSNGGLFNAITGGGFQGGNNTGCRWYNDEFAASGNTNFQSAYDSEIGNNFTTVTNEFVEPLSGPNAGTLIPFNGVSWQQGSPGGGFSVDVLTGTADVPSWSVQRVTQLNRINNVSTAPQFPDYALYDIGRGSRFNIIELSGTISSGWRTTGGQINQPANGSSGTMSFPRAYFLSHVQITTFSDAGAGGLAYVVDVEGSSDGINFTPLGTVNGVHGTAAVLAIPRAEYTDFRFTWVSSDFGSGIRGQDINFGIDYRTVSAPSSPEDAAEFKVVNDTNEVSIINTPTGKRLLEPGRSLLMAASNGVFYPVESLSLPIPEINNRAENGYVDIGNIRMQWGRAVTDGTGQVFVDFPVSFSDVNFSFTANAGNGGTVSMMYLGETTSGLQVIARNENGNAVMTSFSWIAIGLRP